MLPKILHVSSRFLEGVKSTTPVHNNTHNLYIYPARFSPLFVKNSLLEFATTKDLVLDPFAGGGTTLVEAMNSGIKSVGFDTNSLACFISKVKTTPLTDLERKHILDWLPCAIDQANLHTVLSKKYRNDERGYKDGLPWTIRKFLELIVRSMDDLRSTTERDFIRCTLLRVGQWSLGKLYIPSAEEVRLFFSELVQKSLDANREQSQNLSQKRPSIFNKSIDEIDKAWWKNTIGKKPSLVITSPPYPNVHVLYHRWQIMGRKETAAPYWIANRLDGKSQSYYTLGARTKKGVDDYFLAVQSIFSKLYELLAPNALVIQLVGFSNDKQHFNKYLAGMENAGFLRLTMQSGFKFFPYLKREVPHRRWYATIKESLSTSSEFLIIHKKG